MPDSKPMKKAFSAKVSSLMKDDKMPQRQALAVAFAEKDKGGIKRLRKFSKKK